MQLRQESITPRLRTQTDAIKLRPSQTENSYVQISRAFIKLSWVLVQTFLHAPDFFEFNTLACVYDQTFLFSPTYRLCNGILCVHVQTFVRSQKVLLFNGFACVYHNFVSLTLSRVLCVHKNCAPKTALCVCEAFVQRKNLLLVSSFKKFEIHWFEEPL